MISLDYQAIHDYWRAFLAEMEAAFGPYVAPVTKELLDDAIPY